MALKQLSAGIMVGVFALITIGTELVLASGALGFGQEQFAAADSALTVLKDKPLRDRLRFEPGPKF
jgi:hypothetical protein